MRAPEEAERLLEQADAARAELDLDAAVAHLSAAVRAFTADGSNCRAAMACVRLGDTLAYGMGNQTAGRAWFARARRLVAGEPDCVEQGWVAVAAMGCDVDDPADLLARSELALDRARRFGDVNLETKALADAGLAHVQAGRLAEGMALLDEAMALACGPADDVDVAGKSVCSFLTACYHAADFERAGSWTDLLRRRGVIGQAPAAPMFLSSHCDSVEATLLMELGRWGEAEATLQRSIADFERVLQMPSWHPAICLADLRIRQGRLAEAEALLLGKEGALEALLPAARLHLARGDAGLAEATARRGLRLIGGDRVRAVALLTVLVEAHLARADVAAAAEAATELTERVEPIGVPVLEARTAAARAKVLVATGDPRSAVELLQTSLDSLGLQLPWVRVTLLLELARLYETVGDVAAARVEAKAAVSELGALDVVLVPADRALLARLEPHAAALAREPAVLRRDGAWWSVVSAGSSVRLRDTKGLRYLAELLTAPGVERHALDLVDRIEGVDAETGLDRRSLGDAGPTADASARDAYRHRVADLRSQIDDCLETGRLERAEALQEEVDALVQQLAQAFGLDGRDRKAASAAERARLNVTRALRAAIARVAAAMPDAGAALDRGVRTGIYCSYTPHAGDIGWIVQRGVNGSAPG